MSPGRTDRKIEGARGAVASASTSSPGQQPADPGSTSTCSSSGRRAGVSEVPAQRWQRTPRSRHRHGHELLRFAACMRRHGIVNFPGPDSDGQLPSSIRQIDRSSPMYTVAKRGCATPPLSCLFLARATTRSHLAQQGKVPNPVQLSELMRTRQSTTTSQRGRASQAAPSRWSTYRMQREARLTASRARHRSLRRRMRGRRPECATEACSAEHNRDSEPGPPLIDGVFKVEGRSTSDSSM
jgi:hypothetical protein